MPLLSLSAALEPAEAVMGRLRYSGKAAVSQVAAAIATAAEAAGVSAQAAESASSTAEELAELAGSLRATVERFHC